MANRAGWAARSDSYRKRLEGAGRSGKLSGEPMTPDETRAYWEAGGDLRGGRGHRPLPPRGTAPAEPTTRAKVGIDRPQDRKALERWRRSRLFPRWLPKDPADMDTPTAATLSVLPPPSRWRSVEMVYLPSGQVRMIVQPKGNAYPITVNLRDRGAASDVMSMLNRFTYKGLAISKAGEGYPSPVGRGPAGPKPPRTPTKATRPARRKAPAKRPAKRKAPKAPKAPGLLDLAAQAFTDIEDLFS